MKQYKLIVRDKIPSKINESGHNATALKITNNMDFAEGLSVSLLKEAIEYSNTNNSIDKLADIYTLILYILKAKGISYSDFLEVYAKRLEEYGGYEERYFLIETDEEN